MLAVTWGCEKMSKYIHGLPKFTTETDHKPLIPILNNKPLSDITLRIQRMRMKLLKFDFHAEHIKGTDLTDADAMSRAPWSAPTKDDEIAEKEVIIHVATVISNIPATESRLAQIRAETLLDRNLQAVIKHIHQGWPQHKRNCAPAAHPYWHCYQDLTEAQGIVLKGDKIVIPKSMQKDMLQRSHGNREVQTPSSPMYLLAWYKHVD